MKLWYQSYVDYENGASYWDMLQPHLNAIAGADIQVDIRGITPFDSYAHPLMEWRCGREMICNAVQAERRAGGGQAFGGVVFVCGHGSGCAKGEAGEESGGNGEFLDHDVSLLELKRGTDRFGTGHAKSGRNAERCHNMRAR